MRPPPHRLRQPTPQAVIEQIERLRRQRWTGKQIAVEVGVSAATVSRVLRRLGLNKLSALEPAEPVRRYERENPGELIHLDIKKLGRIGSVGHRINNGSCYRSKTFRAACKRLGLRQIFTRPYTPKTNGKAERFIQTAFHEWAYARAYENSDQRSAELLSWLHRYMHRPHGSLKAKTPISRLGLSEDNQLRLHSHT